MRRPDIKNTDDFNERLQERNPNLKAISEYENRNTKIKVQCTQCGNVMSHKTPFAWLYDGEAQCYYCDNLPYSKNVETYRAYVERRTNGRITPLGEYTNTNTLMEFRCNLHNEVFKQSHAELFRKDGKGGTKCRCCRDNVRKIYLPEELLSVAQEHAPNLVFLDEFKNKNGKVRYKCNNCGYSGETSFAVLEHSRKGTTFCPNCNNRLRKGKDKFEEELQKLNPNLVVTSDYKNANTAIAVRCERCGHTRTDLTPHEWSRDPRCYYCESKRFNPNVETYPEYVQRKYGDKYLVLSETWSGAKERHLYYCTEHDKEFWQTPDAFEPKRANCPMCAAERNSTWIRKQTKEHNQFIAELSKQSPEIEVLGKYRGTTKPIAVRCRVCGHEWAPTAGPLLYQATQCPRCSGSELTAEEFRKRVKENSPTLKIIGKFYKREKTIRVRCKNCQTEWDARKDVLLRGCGCKICQKAGTSRPELMMKSIVEAYFADKEVIWQDRSLIGMELDLYVPEEKVAIEIGDWYYHKEKTAYDLRKELECEKKGVKLYTIYFTCKEQPTVSFKRLKCFTDRTATKKQTIELIKKCIKWLSECEGWTLDCTKIDYDRVWGKASGDYNSSPKDALDDNSVLEDTACKKVPEESKTFEEIVRELRDDCVLVDDYVNSRTKLRVRCTICNKNSDPMLPAAIKRGKRMSCFKLHAFEEMMAEKHPTIKYSVESFGKESNDSRFNHIDCECLVCGKKWSPSEDSLKRGHGCPNYRDERHGIREYKTNSWRNGSNVQIYRDDGVIYKSVKAAAEGERVSRNKMYNVLNDDIMLNGHSFLRVKRDERIRRKSTGEIYTEIKVAAKKTKLSKAHIYRQISDHKDFEWVISRD